MTQPECEAKGVNILVTGGLGLIGARFVKLLRSVGYGVDVLDIRAEGVSKGDVRDLSSIESRIRAVDGIVHLAAVSRVVSGEREPLDCWATNVGGTANVLLAASNAPVQPWVVVASSREVYGEPDELPVSEHHPLRPVNVYGKTKVVAEQLADHARDSGGRIATLRFSNVYGSTYDHIDRVIPAFLRAALSGATLRVDGGDNMFDFTHVDDVCDGILKVVSLMNTSGKVETPIHLVSGRRTTLKELADLAININSSDSEIVHAEPRNFDVGRFVGSGSKALSILGWSPKIELEAGLTAYSQALNKNRT